MKCYLVLTAFCMLWLRACSFSCASHGKMIPIVFAAECDKLRTQLASASVGDSFLLMTDMKSQETGPSAVRDNLRFLLQLSLVAGYTLGRSIVQIDTTFANDLSVETEPTSLAHGNVVQSLNLVRAFLQGKMGDARNHGQWTIVSNREYERFLARMGECLRFIETFASRRELCIDRYHIGHKLGILPYEQMMTRQDSVSGEDYSCSSHFLWVEEAESFEKGASYFNSIQNPVGVLVSEETPWEQLFGFIEKTNPSNEAGRLVLIVRMRAIRSHLTGLLEQITKRGYHVVWCCQPTGHAKTNLKQFLDTLRCRGVIAGGIFLTGPRGREALETVQYMSSYQRQLLQ